MQNYEYDPQDAFWGKTVEAAYYTGTNIALSPYKSVSMPVGIATDFFANLADEDNQKTLVELATFELSSFDYTLPEDMEYEKWYLNNILLLIDQGYSEEEARYMTDQMISNSSLYY